MKIFAETWQKDNQSTFHSFSKENYIILVLGHTYMSDLAQVTFINIKNYWTLILDRWMLQVCMHTAIQHRHSSLLTSAVASEIPASVQVATLSCRCWMRIHLHFKILCRKTMYLLCDLMAGVGTYILWHSNIFLNDVRYPVTMGAMSTITDFDFQSKTVRFTCTNFCFKFLVHYPARNTKTSLLS